MQDLGGEVGPLFVERQDDVAAEFEQGVVGKQRIDDGLAEVAVGKGGAGVHVAERADDGGVGNHDGGAGAGKAEFGEADGKNHAGLPGRLEAGMDDAGERVTVGVVNDERDVVLSRQIAQAVKFFLGEDVAGGVGGAGDAEGGDVGRDAKAVEVDVIFEFVGAALLDFGGIAAEHAGAESLAGIADVFGHQGKKDALLGVASLARQEIEQQEEGGLAAGEYSDVLGLHVPLAFAFEEGGEVLTEQGVAAWRVVVEQRFVERGLVVDERLHAFAPEGLDGGNGGGLASAKHAHVGLIVERLTEVIHEFLDAAGAGETLADVGK